MARKRSRRKKTSAKAKRKPARRKVAARRKPAARNRKKAPARSRARKPAARRRRLSEEQLLGPPPREAMLMRSDRERIAAERQAERTATSPRLAGGDVDADWERAASSGEEAVGGSVATPDQDVVDELGDALGVGRAPDAPVRSSEEILKARDARRHRREP